MDGSNQERLRSIDLEQQGGGSNLIGGVGSVAGTLTDFDFIGTTNTLDINQIGSSNLWKGDINSRLVHWIFSVYR